MNERTGVLIAVLSSALGGGALALTASLGTAPDDAWRGDLIMAGATLCMALYNVFARPFIARSSALGFLTLGMAAGSGALGFFLRVVALRHASPTRVANTITVNPLIAMASGTMLLGEPITITLVLGLVAVCTGVWVATT